MDVERNRSRGDRRNENQRWEKGGWIKWEGWKEIWIALGELEIGIKEAY